MSVNVGSAVAYLELDSSKFTAGLKTAQESLKGVSKDSASFGDKLQSVGSSVKTVGSTLSLLSVPLLGLGAAALKTAAGFEAGMSEVKAITGATGKDFEALENQAKQLGSTTKFSASEAAEGMKFFGMAGYDTEKILAAMPSTLNLAAAAGTDLGLTCDIVSDAMSGLKMSADETGRFTDVMAATVTGANTSVALMGETMKYVAPVAGTLGINVEDLSLAIGIMGNNGIKGSQAGTALKAGLVNLVKPTDTMYSYMKKYGIALKENEDGTVDLRKTMENLREKMGKLSETEQAAALSAIFGKEAMAGWSAVVNASEEDFYKLAESIDNSNGKAEEMADIMQDNLQGALTNLGSAFEGVLITIGEALIPVIKEVVQKLNDWCTWFNTLDGTTQTIIIAVGGFIAILGPLLIIVGQLIISVGAIVGALGSVTIAGVGLGSAFGMLVSAAAPIIAIFAAIIAVGYLVVNNWDWICECAKKTGEDIKKNWEESCQAVANWWEWISQQAVIIWERIKQDISDVWEAIKLVIEGVGVAIKVIVTVLWEAIKFVTVGQMQLILNNIKTTWELIKTVFSTVLNIISTIVSNVFNLIKNNINTIMQGISNQINIIWNTIKTIFSNVLGLIKGIVTLDFGLIKSSISNILNAVKNFCSQTWSNILNTCSSILGNITKTVKNIFDGIKNSIATGLRNAYNTALGWWNNIKNIFKNPISAVVNIFKNDNTRARSEYNIEDTEVASMKTRDFNLDAVNYVFSSAKTATDILATSSLVGLTKDLEEQKTSTNNTQNININLNIDKVENSNERNIEELANELAFYIKRKNIGFGRV